MISLGFWALLWPMYLTSKGLKINVWKFDKTSTIVDIDALFEKERWFSIQRMRIIEKYIRKERFGEKET